MRELLVNMFVCLFVFRSPRKSAGKKSVPSQSLSSLMKPSDVKATQGRGSKASTAHKKNPKPADLSVIHRQVRTHTHTHTHTFTVKGFNIRTFY